MRLQLQQLLLMQMIGLYTLANIYVSEHPNFNEWYEKVLELPEILRAKFGASVEIEHKLNPESKIFEQVSTELGFKAFYEQFGSSEEDFSETTT